MSQITSQQLTSEQDAIIEAAAGRQSLLVNAGAGCGKSSTLALAAARVRVPALSLTFARTNTEDARRLLPGNWTVRSFNGLGHAAWARSSRCKATALALDERKVGKLVTQVARDHHSQLSRDQWAQVRDLVDKARTDGMVPVEHQREAGPASGEGLRPDTPSEWAEMALELGVPDQDTGMIGELARTTLVRCIDLAITGTIDYDDQVYCPVMLGGHWPQFPLVAVDESQDLSPLQIVMVQRASRPGGRLMVVGDRAQAIYAWRGASGNAEQLLRWLLPPDQWLDLPLMTSFRCPHSVAERQREHVPGFRSAPGNPRGRVEDWRHERHGQTEAWTWAQLAEAKAEIGHGAGLAVLCRNNAPLVRMAFQLLRMGVGCQMLGRDIGQQAQALGRRLVGEADTQTECKAKIDQWQSDETAKLLANGHEHRVEALWDRCGVLLAVLDGAEATSGGAMLRLLERLFAPPAQAKANGAGLVTLSSIHRAKGREWDLVVRLDPWRGRPKPQGETRSQVELGQEANLAYVAETRARHTLVLANAEDFRPGRGSRP